MFSQLSTKQFLTTNSINADSLVCITQIKYFWKELRFSFTWNFRKWKKSQRDQIFLLCYASINLNYLHWRSEVFEQKLRSWFHSFKARDVGKLDHSSQSTLSIKYMWEDKKELMMIQNCRCFYYNFFYCFPRLPFEQAIFKQTPQKSVHSISLFKDIFF